MIFVIYKIWSLNTELTFEYNNSYVHIYTLVWMLVGVKSVHFVLYFVRLWLFYELSRKSTTFTFVHYLSKCLKQSVAYGMQYFKSTWSHPLCHYNIPFIHIFKPKLKISKPWQKEDKERQKFFSEELTVWSSVTLFLHGLLLDAIFCLSREKNSWISNAVL